VQSTCQLHLAHPGERAGPHVTQHHWDSGRLEDEPWLFVAGEIDEYSYKSLIRTLASVARDPSEIHIDLADVEYCDVAGLRAFVVLAAAPCCDHAGMRVVLHHVPPCSVNVLHILGWDTTTGLTLAEGRQIHGPVRPLGPGRLVSVLLSIRVAWAGRRVLPALQPRAPCT
jgi:anti-anti-sigma regulatory factor